MEKYFYFRKDGSCLIPVKHLLSMGSTANGSLALRFRPRMNQFSDSADSASNKTDSITLTVADNTQKTVIEAILVAMAQPMIAGSPNMINLFDAVAGTGITGVTAASVAIVAAQA